MVSRTTELSYQHTGTFSSIASYNFSEYTEKQSTSVYGQRSGEILHLKKQIQITHTAQRNKEPCVTLSRTRHNSLGDSDTFHIEHCSGFIESHHRPTNRMVSAEESIHPDPGMVRSPNHRPNGNAIQCATTTVHLAIPPPSGGRLECTNSKLEPVESCLYLSSSKDDTPIVATAPLIQRPRSVHCSMATNSSMVSRVVQKSKRPSTYKRTIGSRCTRSNHLFKIKWIREMDRISFLIRILTMSRGRKLALQLTKAYRKSSQHQAETAWKHFQTWLPDNSSTITKRTILKFLLYAHKKLNLSPRTVLCYKSSLTWPLNEAFGVNFRDKDFSLLNKSLFLENPPKPQMIPQWSLNHALETLSSSDFQRNQSTEAKLYKALFLTALASGNLSSELYAMSRIGIVESNDFITIPLKLNFLFKNQSYDRCPPPIKFPKLGNKHPLCPASAINQFILATQENDHKGHLFVHHKTGTPLSGGRIHYWISKAISKIDGTLRGRPHDLRKFAFSASWARGTNLKDILDNGFWSSPNPFINKYCVQVESKLPRCVAGRTIIK